MLVIERVRMCRVGLFVCCLSLIVLLSTYPSRCSQQFTSKIAFNQPIHILWLECDVTDYMASSHRSPSLVVPAASYIAANDPVAASEVVFTPLTLATGLAPQAGTGTSYA